MIQITINAEVNFHEQEVASIFQETNVAGRDEQFAELCFAGAFAIRMMSNMGASVTKDMIGQLLKIIAQLIVGTPQNGTAGEYARTSTVLPARPTFKEG